MLLIFLHVQGKNKIYLYEAQNQTRNWLTTSRILKLFYKGQEIWLVHFTSFIYNLQLNIDYAWNKDSKFIQRYGSFKLILMPHKNYQHRSHLIKRLFENAYREDVLSKRRLIQLHREWINFISDIHNDHQSFVRQSIFRSCLNALYFASIKFRGKEDTS